MPCTRAQVEERAGTVSAVLVVDVHHAVQLVRTAVRCTPAQVAEAGTLGAAVCARAQQKPSASTS